MMSIIAIPLKDDRGLQSAVNEHFSRSPFFLIIDEPLESNKVIENSAAFKPGHEGTMELLHENSVENVLCSGIGPGALDYASELKIRVCFGRAKNAQELYEKYTRSELENVVDGSVCGPGL